MKGMLLSLLAMSAGACSADAGDGSFVIRDNLAPDMGLCQFTADTSAATLTRGQLFLDSPTPYVINPLIESRIVAAEGKESLRTIQIKGARVDLAIGPINTIDAAGNVSTDSAVDTLQFESLFSASLPPNGGLVTGSFDLIPDVALSMIRQRAGAGTVHAQVVGNVQLFGDFYGDELESEPFQYPVTVCSDCVVASRFSMCPVASTTTVREGNPCNPFQDGVVDCCIDTMNGNALTCPAPKAQ